jgi:hypothetical protein
MRLLESASSKFAFLRSGLVPQNLGRIQPISTVSRFLDMLPAFICSLIVLLPLSPWNVNFIDTDPGVFLYFGWRILNGEIPYRDIWDHKPPLIYYINALGEFLTPNSLWGIWLLEFLSLFIASYIGYRIFKFVFGKSSAVLSTFYWLITLFFILRLGNLTEEFALPIQFASIWIFIQIINKKHIKANSYILGVFTALLFFLKQTNVGICLAIFLVLSIHRIKSRKYRQLILDSVALILGFFSIVAIISIYIGANGALSDFWNNTFIYNVPYLSKSPLTAIYSSFIGLGNLMTTGFLIIGCLGGFFALKTWRSKTLKNDSLHEILLLSITDIPIEFLLISLSGRAYEHYYITLLPPFAILVAFAFQEISGFVTKNTSRKLSPHFLLGYSLLLLVFGVSLPYIEQFKQINNLSNNDLIHAISDLTDTSDNVLVYGANAGINYKSKHTSPSRYVYQYPLYTENYVSEKMILEFMDDIILNKPSLILDTHNPATPFFDFPINSYEIDHKVEVALSRYEIVQEVMGVTIYQYSDD